MITGCESTLPIISKRKPVTITRSDNTLPHSLFVLHTYSHGEKTKALFQTTAINLLLMSSLTLKIPSLIILQRSFYLSHMDEEDEWEERDSDDGQEEDVEGYQSNDDYFRSTKKN